MFFIFLFPDCLYRFNEISGEFIFDKEKVNLHNQLQERAFCQFIIETRSGYRLKIKISDLILQDCDTAEIVVCVQTYITDCLSDMIWQICDMSSDVMWQMWYVMWHTWCDMWCDVTDVTCDVTDAIMWCDVTCLKWCDRCSIMWHMVCDVMWHMWHVLLCDRCGMWYYVTHVVCDVTDAV